MKKQIKKWGQSLLISFTEEEQEIYGINENDVFDVELCKVRKEGFTKQDLNKAFEETGALFGVDQ